MHYVYFFSLICVFCRDTFTLVFVLVICCNAAIAVTGIAIVAAIADIADIAVTTIAALVAIVIATVIIVIVVDIVLSSFVVTLASFRAAFACVHVFIVVCLCYFLLVFIFFKLGLLRLCLLVQLTSSPFFCAVCFCFRVGSGR